MKTPPPMPRPVSTWRVATVTRVVAVLGTSRPWPIVVRADAAAKPARKRRGA